MIDMQVRTERDEIVVHGSHGVGWTESLLRVDRKSFPFLSSLLPYANTIFNSRQAERLRLEVSDQSVRALLGEDVALEIERLCRQVEGGAHLYLWFVGD